MAIVARSIVASMRFMQLERDLTYLACKTIGACVLWADGRTKIASYIQRLRIRPVAATCGNIDEIGTRLLRSV